MSSQLTNKETATGIVFFIVAIAVFIIIVTIGGHIVAVRWRKYERQKQNIQIIQQKQIDEIKENQSDQQPQKQRKQAEDMNGNKLTDIQRKEKIIAKEREKEEIELQKLIRDQKLINQSEIRDQKLINQSEIRDQKLINQSEIRIQKHERVKYEQKQPRDGQRTVNVPPSTAISISGETTSLNTQQISRPIQQTAFLNEYVDQPIELENKSKRSNRYYNQGQKQQVKKESFQRKQDIILPIQEQKSPYKEDRNVHRRRNSLPMSAEFRNINSRAKLMQINKSRKQNYVDDFEIDQQTGLIELVPPHYWETREQQRRQKIAQWKQNTAYQSSNKRIQPDHNDINNINNKDIQDIQQRDTINTLVIHQPQSGYIDPSLLLIPVKPQSILNNQKKQKRNDIDEKKEYISLEKEKNIQVHTKSNNLILIEEKDYYNNDQRRIAQKEKEKEIDQYQRNSKYKDPETNSNYSYGYNRNETHDIDLMIGIENEQRNWKNEVQQWKRQEDYKASQEGKLTQIKKNEKEISRKNSSLKENSKQQSKGSKSDRHSSNSHHESHPPSNSHSTKQQQKIIKNQIESNQDKDLKDQKSVRKKEEELKIKEEQKNKKKNKTGTNEKKQDVQRNDVNTIQKDSINQTMKEKEKDVSYQSTRSKSKSDSSSSRHHSHRSSSDKEQIHSVRSTDSRRVQSDSDEQEQISDQDIIVEANVERGSQRDYFNGEREEDSLFGYSVLESNAHKEGID